LNLAVHDRLFGWMLLQFKRLAIAALFVAAATWLAHRVGIWPAILIMALAALGLCAGIGWMLRRTPLGRVTLINRVVPIVLPFGLHVGRGKPWPIVACSWAAWTILSAAAAIHAGSGFSLFPHATAASHNAPVLRAILIASLIIDAIGFGYLINLWAKRLGIRSPGLKPMLTLLFLLAFAMAGGMVLWRMGWPISAVMVAGAPPAIVGGFYGAFLLLMAITRPRWN
jgi:hypothetical protein